MTRGRVLAAAGAGLLSLGLLAPAASAEKTVVGCTVIDDRGFITYQKSNGDTKTKETTAEKATAEASEAGVICRVENK